MLITLLAHLFFKCLEKARLLDEEDHIRLSEAFDSLKWTLHFGIITCSSLLIALSSYCCFKTYWWVKEAEELSLYSAAVVFLILLFVGQIVFLPIFVSRHCFADFDTRFQVFVSSLKRREMCLFGTAYLYSDGDRALLPCRAERARCLGRLRVMIHRFTSASSAITASNSIQADNHQLISAHINEELRRLCGMTENMDSNGDEDQDRFNTIDNDLLHVAALKTCWQFMFIVRSEFFRIAFIWLLTDDTYGWRERWKLIGLLGRTVTETAFLSRATVLPATIAGKKTHRLRDDGSGGAEMKAYGRIVAEQLSASSLTPYIVQMEWILENFHTLRDALPATEGVAAARRFVPLLRDIVSALGNSAHDAVPPSASEVCRGDEEVLVMETECDMAEAMTADVMDDFQIFEMDEADDFDRVALNDEAGRGDGGRAEESDRLAEPLPDNRPLLRELHSAIAARKEVCIQREMRALARRRRVPLAEISRDELERVELCPPDCEQDNDNIERAETNVVSKEPPISRGAFGGMPSADDLQAILRQRQMFAAPDFVAIGEGPSSSESEEDEESALLTAK